MHKYFVAVLRNAQDLISAFYYLRNNYKVDDFVKGESIEMNILFDDDGAFKFNT